MKKMLMVGLLLSLQVLADDEPAENDSVDKETLKTFVQVCEERVADQNVDNEQAEILKCVNEELEDSGYETFASMKAISDFLEKEDDEEPPANGAF